MAKNILDGFKKSRHSSENVNPTNSNCLKILDSCLRRNDMQWPLQIVYKTISLKKQEGMALVIALLILLILTIIGINAINTTVFESSISGNQRIYNTAFYGGDGGIEDFKATMSLLDHRGIRDQILDRSITSYSDTIPGSNITYNITATYLGEINRGGTPYMVFRVISEGVAPNFPFSGRVSVETIEEIDPSGGGNVAEIKKYN